MSPVMPRPSARRPTGRHPPRPRRPARAAARRSVHTRSFPSGRILTQGAGRALTTGDRRPSRNRKDRERLPNRRPRSEGGRMEPRRVRPSDTLRRTCSDPRPQPIKKAHRVTRPGAHDLACTIGPWIRYPLAIASRDRRCRPHRRGRRWLRWPQPAPSAPRRRASSAPPRAPAPTASRLGRLRDHVCRDQRPGPAIRGLEEKKPTSTPTLVHQDELTEVLKDLVRQGLSARPGRGGRAALPRPRAAAEGSTLGDPTLDLQRARSPATTHPSQGDSCTSSSKAGGSGRSEEVYYSHEYAPRAAGPALRPRQAPGRARRPDR